ncbi:MAG: hypothetical protein DRQ14_08790 [Candidatus Latescibacterota bacterium]|nr:MAG: hypothetical protein DRQ14_08790 [Candidatus Latescibacterota bacterium]HDH99894.1 ABC transporter permease [Bacillota bacterium]
MGPLGHIGTYVIKFFEHMGRFGILALQTARALTDVSTYAHPTLKQMVRIGVESLPIVLVTSTFTGMVSSLQTFYQLKSAMVPVHTMVGSAVEKMIFLELAPSLTALVLAGRVGATIAAELGTMRVTEQIDALETLAFNPVAYLVVPRVLAGMVMFPVLTIFSMAVGVVGAWVVSVCSGISSADFLYGMRLFFKPWDVYYGVIKSVFFGLSIVSVGCYEGFFAEGGAEGVGRATTKAVVVACLLILMWNYILALILL